MADPTTVQPFAYIWRCERGHEAAISELAMLQSIALPRCPRRYEWGDVCMARLVRRLRPFPDVTHA